MITNKLGLCEYFFVVCFLHYFTKWQQHNKGYVALTSQLMTPLHVRDCCTSDLMYNGEPVTVEVNSFESELVARKVNEIIKKHNQSKPLFAYVAFQAVHVPFVEAPEEYSKPYESMLGKVNEERYKLLTMISALDRALENIVGSLKEAGMWEDTLFVFTSDNGGAARAASNWPLRGAKLGYYEGGIRGPTLVHHSSLSSYVSNKMMHITDWLPTIMSAIQCDENLHDIDGVDQWDAIKDESIKTPRNTMLINLLPNSSKPKKSVMEEYKEEMKIFNIGTPAAVRKHDFKLLTVPTHGVWTAPRESTIVSPKPATDTKPLELYNLANDPYEQHEISEEHPEVVKELLEILAEHQKRNVKLKHHLDKAGCSENCGPVLPWLD
uniref:Arylsulfatase I-like n=1 Tax=Phallusia mammillata TaxID=59560 RepID=A0A6F9D7F7_9ASCI|nr:arylsulfatase I-like [Phallusia mammillata]